MSTTLHDAAGTRGTLNFSLGLLAGTAVGAALTLWLAPRVTAEIRARLASSADAVGDRASARYRKTSDGITATLDGLAARGEAARDDLADAVVHGARDVERWAKQAKAVRFSR